MRLKKVIHNENGAMLWKVIFSFVLALCGNYGIAGTMALEKSIGYTNSFTSVLVFAISFYAIYNSLPLFLMTTTRKRAFAVLFAFPLSVFLHFGSDLESVEHIAFCDFSMWLSILFLSVFLAVLVHALWEWISKHLEKMIKVTQNEAEHGMGMDHFFRNAVYLFLMWLPVFFAFFPGAFVYDAQEEYVEVASRIFTTHHPLLHVLLLGGSIRAFEHFGISANIGIAFYTLLQMCILSVVFSYFFILLSKWGVKKKYCLASLFFIGLFPVFPMYAVCSAKDTLFTAMYFLTLLFLFDLYKRGVTIGRIILFVLASVLMMLLRNNGIYAYVAAGVVMTLACIRRRDMRIVGGLMLLSVFLALFGSFVLKTMLHATDTEHQEMLTVPIQQLARVYQYEPDVYSQEEKEILYQYLPKEALSLYTPRISDLLKSKFDNDAYEKNPGAFMKLWIRTGIKKPLVYLNAWFLTSYGYWYPDMMINVYGGNQMYTFQYRESSYFGFETEPPGERHSLFPALEVWYQKLSLEIYQQKIPVVSMMFAPGFLFYVFLFFLIYLIREKKRTAFILGMIFFLWLTVLLGPTILVRYVLILWFVMPLLPVLATE